VGPTGGLEAVFLWRIGTRFSGGLARSLVPVLSELSPFLFVAVIRFSLFQQLTESVQAAIPGFDPRQGKYSFTPSPSYSLRSPSFVRNS
jgi:hypothetical protein